MKQDFLCPVLRAVYDSNASAEKAENSGNLDRMRKAHEHLNKVIDEANAEKLGYHKVVSMAKQTRCRLLSGIMKSRAVPIAA